MPPKSLLLVYARNTFVSSESGVCHAFKKKKTATTQISKYIDIRVR